MFLVTGVASLQSTVAGHCVYSTLHMYSPASEYRRPDICRLLDRVSVAVVIVNRVSLLSSAPFFGHCHWYW